MKYRLQRFPLLTLALGLLLAMGAQASAANDGCSAAQERLLEQVAGLEPTYENISDMSLAQRRAFYGSLALEDRQALWIQHISRAALGAPGLSGAQLDFLNRVLKMLEAGELLAASHREPNALRALEVEQEARQLWDREGVFRIFATLGAAPNDPKGTFTPEAFLCECSVQSDWCLIGGSDCRSSYSCSKTSVGCGWLWKYSCDGLCFL
jgi:hypothetical protein